MSAPRFTTIFAGLNCKCGTERHYQGAAYYVSCRRDDGRHALLAGPYTEHHQALDVLDRVKCLADDYDPRACWYSYGTCAVLAGKRPAGVLNDALAAALDAERLDRDIRAVAAKATERITRIKARRRETTR